MTTQQNSSLYGLSKLAEKFIKSNTNKIWMDNCFSLQ